MPTATLDDLMALNDQLGALQRAGVPLDLGLGSSDEEVAVSLARINATVARRVSQGQTLAEALERDDPSLPSTYRCFVQTGLQSGDWSAALQGYRALSQTDDDSRFALWSGLVYPLIVCALAYVGLIMFCVCLVPELEHFYGDLGLRPGIGLEVVRSLRETLPMWIAIPPVMLLFTLGWRRRRTARHGRAGRVWSLFPGMSYATHLRNCAHFADTLASLTDSGLPTTKALRLAAGTCGDSRVTKAAEALAGQWDQRPTNDRQDHVAQAFPPFLRWALWNSSGATVSPHALRMAAAMYRGVAERRAERMRVVMPLAACALFGGGATLLYGLALFLPVVEMLRQLAS